MKFLTSMKYLTFLCLSLVVSMSLLAQAKPVAKTAVKKTAAKPVAKKTGPKKPVAKGKKSSKSNKLKTADDHEFEEVICYEDGPCTFNILKKDTLVYEVNTAGKQYNLLIIPNKFDANTIADFNWRTTGADMKSGHVVINSQGLNTGKKYMFDLPSGELKLTDASTFWISNVNFKEISKGETTLALDNGQPETFKSLEVDAVSTEINYKGKQLNLEGFAVANKAEGEAGRKEVWILNISTNLLIIKLDNNSWSMVLKEVRERKLN
jgi:hypothetical protein